MRSSIDGMWLEKRRSNTELWGIPKLLFGGKMKNQQRRLRNADEKKEKQIKEESGTPRDKRFEEKGNDLPHQILLLGRVRVPTEN